MSDRTDPAVSLRIEGSVARLCLNRPRKRNALTEAMWRALGESAVSAVEQGAQMLVLESSGAHFSAGADLSELREQLADRDRLIGNAGQVQAVQRRFESLPIPTLALIRGACVGGGVGLALCCDLRLAMPDAVFALTPVRLGLHYSLADTRRLAGVVGLARAREMLLTARTVAADEAERWQLIHRVCKDPAEMSSSAESILENWQATSPAALAATKRVLAHLSGTGEDDPADLDRLFLEAFEHPDFAEGAQAFLDKRQPRFSER